VIVFVERIERTPQLIEQGKARLPLDVKLGHFVASGHSKVLFYWVTTFLFLEAYTLHGAPGRFTGHQMPCYLRPSPAWQKFSSWLSPPLQKHLVLQ